MREMNYPNEESTAVTVIGADPSWGTLHKAGGFSAILYVILAITVPTLILLATRYDLNLDGVAFLCC